MGQVENLKLKIFVVDQYGSDYAARIFGWVWLTASLGCLVDKGSSSMWMKYVFDFFRSMDMVVGRVENLNPFKNLVVNFIWFSIF